MNAVVYLFQVSACMGIFYLFYYLLLSRYTFFTINRWYLIITLAISFVIPLLTITVQQQDTYPQVIKQVVYINQMQTPQQVVVADQVPAQVQINWMALVKMIYTVSVAALFLRLMLIVVKFFARVKNRKRTKIGGVLIVKGDEKISNGSFFNYIFLNDDELSADELEQIIAHEMLHVKLYHSVDRVLIKIAQVFLWFNPFVYLYARAIEENHEFEVDSAVSNSTDRNKYAELLFHLSVVRQGTLYHNFSMVPLKKRITMLFTKPSHKMKRIIYLLVVPVVLISCLAFAKLKKEAPGKVKKTATAAVADSNTVRYRQKSKLTPAQRKAQDEGMKKMQAYFESGEGLKKAKSASELAGKTMTFEVEDTALPLTPNPVTNNIVDGIKLKGASGTYSMFPIKGLKNLKKGDVIVVNIRGAGYDRESPLVSIMPEWVTKDGKKIFEADKVPFYPFLYESNKVRFTDGQITNITRYPNGKWKTAVFDRGQGYKFNLSFKPNAPSLNSIKEGANVRLRFIHEVKTGDKTYKINDWVAISTDIKDYGIKNPEWFYKFYELVSTKKVDTVKLSVIDYPERLQQITSVKIDGKDYPKDILYKIGSACIKGKDRKGTTIEITTKNGEITYQSPQDIANLKADYAQKDKFFSRILMQKDDGSTYYQVRLKRATGGYAMDDIGMTDKIGFLIHEKLYSEREFVKLFPKDDPSYGRLFGVGLVSKDWPGGDLDVKDYKVIFKISKIIPEEFLKSSPTGSNKKPASNTGATIRQGVMIKGEVVYPGMYSSPDGELTVAEILKRAGGLTPFGSPENVQVFKNGTGTKVNLSDKNLSSAKIILASVDSIYVPRVSPKVGRVQVKKGTIKTIPNLNDKPGKNLAHTSSTKASLVKPSSGSGLGQYRSWSSNTNPGIGKPTIITGGQSDFMGNRIRTMGFSVKYPRVNKSGYVRPVDDVKKQDETAAPDAKDTVGHNSAALNPLIAKVSGMEVRADGTLWVNNQPVKSVLINGKALTPAEVVIKAKATNTPKVLVDGKEFIPNNIDTKKDLLNSVPKLKADVKKLNDSLVAARFSGKVTTVKEIFGTQLVIIKNGEYFAAYANLTNVNVTAGQEVKRGQVLGEAAFNREENKVAAHFELYRGVTQINNKLERETIINGFEAPKLNMVTNFKNMYAYFLPKANKPL